ncbi:MAG: ABC transporter permease, partial [Betaproteobacteria bacterium]
AFSYSIYLCAGVLTWGFFTETLTKTQNVFLENANLLKKISFPRLSLPVIAVLNASINFFIIFGLFTVFLLLSGNFPGLVFVSLLPLLALQIAFSVGLGVTLGVLNVFFRDIGQFFIVALQFWFWLTPVVYPIGILPTEVRPIVEMNPMTALIGSYQRVLVEGQWPLWNSLLPIAVLAAAFCLLGLRLFRQHAGEMVDEL